MSSPDLGFEEFYATHASRLTRVAFSIVRDRHAAEDVVQTAFAKAFAAWWRVGRADDPVAYARRMVVNAALAYLRKPAVRNERLLADVPEVPGVPGLPEGSPTAGGDDGEMWALLGHLPPRRRAVIVLRYYEGLSEREIAEVLGCRPGTVKSQAAAALVTLRERLGYSGDETRDSAGGRQS